MKSEKVEDGILSIWINVRESYMNKLRGKVASNAGFTGKSKTARAVNRSCGDALLEANLERQGTNRMSATTRFDVSDTDTLTVTYKPDGSRSEITEVYQLLEKTALKTHVPQSTTVLELATNDPHMYFLFKYHYDDVEKGLGDCGLLTKRRRRG